MHNRSLPWLLLFALAAFVSRSALAQAPSAPEMPPGVVLVARIVGTVQMTHNDTTTALRVDDRIPQAARVNTGPASSVVLVFSNGATTQLGEDTEMVLEEFLQDPFGATIQVATLTEEPSTSRTRLGLNRGEIVGQVKRLRHDRGSSFIVQTPVGAAGIRGTTFRIVFRPTGTGQAFFQLSTVEGNVVFQPPGTADPGVPTPAPGADPTAAAAAPGVSVTGGQEVTITVTVAVNAASGQVVVTAPPTVVSAVPIAPQTQAAIVQQAQAIAVAVATTTFTSPPITPGTQTGAGGAGAASPDVPGTAGTTGTAGSNATPSASGTTPGGAGPTTLPPTTTGSTTPPSSGASPPTPTPPTSTSTTPPPPVQQAPKLTPGDGRPGG
jgi:hypothetical protein